MIREMKKFLVYLSVILALTTRSAYAGGGDTGEFNPGEMIGHHIADDHSWHIAGHFSIPLPVIVYSEYGFDMFMSSNFDTAGVYKNYKLEHGHIYLLENGVPKLDANGKPKHALDLSITKNVASMFISVFLLFFIFVGIARYYKKHPGAAPKGKASFFEPIIIYVRDEIAKNNIGEAKYKKFLPYLLTIFFFIWFNNLLGLLPTGANLTGNIAVTLVLATLTFLITNLSANAAYWKHIFATPGVPVALLPIMAIVEFIGIFTKPFSLMVRLFANITAGHIIILSLLGLIFIFKSLAVAPVSVAFSVMMYCLELFVALLQAYVFTLLSAMYIGSAVHDEHHDHEEAHH